MSSKKQSMLRNFLFFFFLLAFVACQRNPLKVDLSTVTVDLAYFNFEDDLFAAKNDLPNELPALDEKYKKFLPVFTYEMIRIGGPESPDYLDQFQSFLNDTLILSVKRNVDEAIDKEGLKEELTEAFRYYRYYFPDRVVPEIYTCVSGFNQSIVMTDSLIGISLEKYLGADCPYYQQLGIAAYKSANMHPGKIVPDVMYAWGMTEFPFDGKATHLIDHMIYEGKLLYFLDAMLPDLADTLKIGYSEKQLDFCKVKEEAMWTYMAEYKLLYSTERMDVKRYIDDAPYTSSFTADSPGRTGVWLGWQIVRSYMKNNPEVSLPELLNDNNYQEILVKSGYQPGR